MPTRQNILWPKHDSDSSHLLTARWVTPVRTELSSDAMCLLFRQFCGNKSVWGTLYGSHRCSHTRSSVVPCLLPCHSLGHHQGCRSLSYFYWLLLWRQWRYYTVHKAVCEMKYWFVSILFLIQCFISFHIKLGLGLPTFSRKRRTERAFFLFAFTPIYLSIPAENQLWTQPSKSLGEDVVLLPKEFEFVLGFIFDFYLQNQIWIEEK